MRFRHAIITALLLVGTCGVTHAQKIDASIRNTNWDSLLAHDHKHFLVDSTEQPEGSIPYEERSISYVIRPSIKRDRKGEIEDEEEGYFSDADYFDINNDGREDAIITLFSGGSGHFGFYVLFIATDSGPQFVTYGGGSGYDIYHHKDTLILFTSHVRNAMPEPDEVPLQDVHRILWKDRKVHKLPVIAVPFRENSPALELVRSFYDEIDKKNYQKAYSYLSIRYRSSHPYDKWVGGYKTTEGVSATIIPAWCSDDLMVTQVNSTDFVNGHEKNQLFYGVWHLIFDAHSGWQLDRPEIREIR